MDESCTNVIAANTEGTLEAQVATNATSLAPPINVKTINKKVIKKSGDVPVVVATATNVVAPATNAVAPATNVVAPATNAAANDAPRKIIRKKTNVV
jgi:hypothetical protein